MAARSLPQTLALAVSLALSLVALPCPESLAASPPTQNAGDSNPRRTPVVRVVQEAGPAVVSIVSARPAQTPFANDQLQRFLGLPSTPQQQKQTTRSLGSGVIIDGKRGFVLTNAHVISGAAEITARLQDGREFQASLVGADPDIDLAVLRLELPGPNRPTLPQARMGDSSDLMIGEPVITIGNPFGLSHTVTTGVISAVNRSVRSSQTYITGLIQTDAAINPGNSGGPMLNILGQVVGINSAVFAKGEGLGFAIPINKAKRVLDELIATGRVAHIWLGLLGENMEQDQAAYFGLKHVGGMVVTDVFPKTPAEAAGIKPGDALLSIGEVEVQDKSQFLALLLNYAKGDSIRVKLRRSKDPFEVRLTPQVLDRQASLNLLDWRWGFSPSTEGKGAASAGGPTAGGGDAGGVTIAEVRAGGPAARLGIKPGDVVLQVGSRRTANEADLLGAFYRYQMHTTLILSVQRGGQSYNVRMKI
ncbi:MAG: trypsin-like peptidase domain-containing protein [Humidesulfovibrio sp.]|uniref:trypsin-like peptidase domain-containing protein n=1 Tax=Humidesulfovibrio sp. TaxID=2910988 RepID=UPI0027FB5E0B|nr:trypsin-like peptidase domain-containing protein [Humidesulfovibrio sp.]MDQ7835160.1 trypsin-like peptidase domain-containing protein [Humidesulfovibrio sp.]